jgi:transposase
MEYVGIDLHKKESQICRLTETGEVIERRIRTEPQRFAEVLGGRPRARILVEASTESEWVARCLEGLGHEVIVADPNFAPMYATRTRKVKTDRRDARALQEACLLGAYRPAHRLSDAQRVVSEKLIPCSGSGRAVVVPQQPAQPIPAPNLGPANGDGPG